MLALRFERIVTSDIENAKGDRLTPQVGKDKDNKQMIGKDIR